MNRIKVLIGVALALFLFKVPAMADVKVSEYAAGTFNVAVVTVSNSVATQIDSTAIGNRAVIEIQNIDATASLWCDEASAGAVVSSSHKITAGSSWILSMSDRGSTNNGASTSAMTVWCISDGGGSTKAAVTQMW